MATVIGVWEVEITVGDEKVLGTIQESQTNDSRGIKSNFILYIDRYKTHRPPVGFSGEWFGSLQSAKQAFKRKYCKNTRLRWKKLTK